MLGEKSLQNIDFTEILSIISNAQSRALASVNREMITMYWEIGRIVCEKTAADGWGKSTVSSLQHFSNRDCLEQLAFQKEISGE